MCDVFVQEYLNDPEKWEGYGCTPIDINGGFVAINKNASDNLTRSQRNIRHRFSMLGVGEPQY